MSVFATCNTLLQNQGQAVSKFAQLKTKLTLSYNCLHHCCKLPSIHMYSPTVIQKCVFIGEEAGEYVFKSGPSFLFFEVLASYAPSKA